MVRGAKQTTKLAFEATIGKVNLGNGEAQVTLVVKQPKPPEIPYQFADGYGDNRKWRKRPSDLAKQKGETDEAYMTRTEKHRADQAEYDKLRALYEERMTRVAPRVMAYAGLVGLAAVFGSKAVSVVITPADQDILPGFAALMPAEDAPQLEAGAAIDEDDEEFE